ncbi:uncharacterized protein [Halyomorpha halys]|uniref:uncharacterized protein n=1 Tax=Halyomorpha halys TaxID=286706 RepID=UPI0034D19921
MAVCCCSDLFVMRTLVLLMMSPFVLTDESATAPKPPTFSSFFNGSFAMEYSTLPVTAASEEETEGRDITDPWYLELMRNVQGYLMECKKKTGAFDDQRRALYKMRDCLMESFLTSLDGFLDEKEIYVNPYLTIVKEKPAGEDILHGDLISAILKRLAAIIDTHSFRIQFHNPQDGVEEFEGRRRHRHYRKAFPMMVAGYMVMSAFLIPLGFQFMAMIGGKALLLAKMAFFMSMFSGYKRLTSDLDYHHHHDAIGGHDHLFHHGGGNFFHHRSAEIPMDAFPSQSPQNYFSLQNTLRKG